MLLVTYIELMAEEFYYSEWPDWILEKPGPVPGPKVHGYHTAGRCAGRTEEGMLKSLSRSLSAADSTPSGSDSPSVGRLRRQRGPVVVPLFPTHKVFEFTLSGLNDYGALSGRGKSNLI